MTAQVIKRYIRGYKDGLETVIKNIPLEKLKLDRQNVRFKHLSREKELSEDEIENLIWDEPDTRVLYNLILNSGGLTEKPFVDDNNVVKEGNRRIVCLRRIIKEVKNGKIKLSVPLERFEQVQCEYAENGVAPLDMDILLARWHVKDKKPWAKLNQASHLYDMKKTRGLNYEEIANEVGLSKGKVLQSCKSFEWTTQYIEKYKVEDVTCWSFFEELYKKKELRDWVLSDRLNLEKFYKWVNEGKFPMAIDVRKLPLILFNLDKQLARELLATLETKGKTIHDALRELASSDPSLNSDFFRAIKRIAKRLDKMAQEDVAEIRQMPAKKKALIFLRDKINATINI
jgi:hypothetical protein